MSRRAAIAAALVLAACGQASNAAPRLAAATGPLTRRARLRYEVNGRAFPLPLVGGTIRGRPVLMLVDTGANSHFVAGWFARRLGIPMRKVGDIGTDHVGKPVATYRVDRPEIAIDGWGKLDATLALATEVPELIERLGIGAFISPQRLSEEGDAVLLDLPKGEMRAVWAEETDLGTDGEPALLDATTCEDNGAVHGLAFVVPTKIESENVRLLLDTGAPHTDVFLSAAGRLTEGSVPNKDVIYSASGKITARKLKDARLTTGTFTKRVDLDLIEGSSEASCPRDGVLAMDVLRGCTILLGRRRVQARCIAPAVVSR